MSTSYLTRLILGGRIFRRSSTVSSCVIGLSLSFVLVPTEWALVLGGIVGGMIGFVTRSSIAVVTMPLLGIAATTVALYTADSAGLLPDTVSPWLILGCVAVATVVACWLFRRTVPTDQDLTATGLVVGIGLFWLLYATRIPWDGMSSLARVSVMEEDNGSWLQGTAELLRSGGAVNTLLGLPLGGWAGSVFGITVVSAARLFFPLEGNALDTAVITMRMYWILTAALSFIGALMTYSAIHRRGSRGSLVAGLVTGLTAIPFALALFTYGHLTALLGVLFGSGTLLILQHTPISIFPGAIHQFLVVSSLVLLFAMGSAWYVSFSLLLAVAGVIGVLSIVDCYSRREQLRQLFASKSRFERSAYVAAIIVAAFFGWRVVIPLARRFADFDYVTYSLSLGGGVAEIEPILAAAIIFFAVTFAASTATTSLRLHVDIIVIALIGLSVAGMFALSYLVPPYGPNYGAEKWLYIASFILLPLTVAGIAVALASRFGNRLIPVSVIVVVVCCAPFVMRWEPYLQTYQLFKPVEPAWWQVAAGRELRESPERTIVCLDTKRDGWSFSALVCTRMLAGLQGNWSQLTSNWYAGNYCNVTSDALKSVDEATWRNLTIIVTDGSRLTSAISCDDAGWAGPSRDKDPQYPLGWLTHVRWRNVRIIDPEGNPVIKSFDYLSNESQYSDEVIGSLNASL